MENGVKESKKNYAKCDSYALAFALINKAISMQFPLQAIAIEESILADRIWSTLNVGMGERTKVESLGVALERWRPTRADKKTGRLPSPHPNAARFDDEMNELEPMLLDWWKARSKVLHGIVKSFQGCAPNICAEDFTANAQFVAEIGLVLVKQVCNWTKKQIRRAKRDLRSEKPANRRGVSK